VSEERPILETIAGCVAIMVNYHNSGPREQATKEMLAEIQAVAKEAEKLSLEIHELAERLFRPVEAELLVRYGHELGVRMNAHFLMAFEGHGMPRKASPETSSKAAPISPPVRH
jgi:hypothetical protein